jgi:hypothetical protein
MPGGHRQQSTKRVLEEMLVGDSNGNGNSVCDENSNDDSINNNGNADAIYHTADMDLMIICVVCGLCEFWRENLPPKNKNCALWFPPYLCRLCNGALNWELFGVL